MMTPAAWLAARSRSYHRDAGRLARLREIPADLTDQQWASVYLAVAAELTKCAEAVALFNGELDGVHGYMGLGGCTCGWWADAELDDAAYREAHRLHADTNGGRPDWVKTTLEQAERP